MAGFTFRQERTYSNTFMYGGHWDRSDVHGTNWMGSIQPQLYLAHHTYFLDPSVERPDLYLLASANWSDAYTWQWDLLSGPVAGHYESVIGDNTRIEVDATSAVLVFPNQDVWTFYWGNPSDKRNGKIQSIVTGYGNGVVFTYDGTSGLLETITSVTARPNQDPSDGYVLTCNYVPVSADTELPSRLSSLQLFRATQGGHEPYPIMTVSYEYATGTVPGRWSAGDLKLVTVSKRSSADTNDSRSIVRKTMYVYYTGSGEEHLLKYIVHSEAYESLEELVGDPLLYAQDQDLDAYADQYVEYDAQKRVSAEMVREGCACAGGGAKWVSYAYTSRVASPDLNSVVVSVKEQWRTSRTSDPLKTRFIDLNWWGQPIQVVERAGDGSSSQPQWITHTKYGTAIDEVSWDGHFGLEREVYHPSAMTSYTPAAFGSSTWTDPVVTLGSDGGLVDLYTYNSQRRMTSKRVTTRGTGGANGNKLSTLVAEWTYRDEATEYRGDLLEQVKWYTASDPNPANADQQTYTYSPLSYEVLDYVHTFYSGDPRPAQRVQEVTTTYGEVSTAHNGPGTGQPAIYRQWYDEYGDLIWAQDAEGSSLYYTYDGLTGLMTSALADVDTDAEGAPTLPTGWTANPNGLNFQSLWTYDELGRITSEVDAEGLTSYAVYKDGETRIYPGWSGTSSLLPAMIVRVDHDDRPTAILGSIQTPTYDSGVPTGQEDIDEGENQYPSQFLTARTELVYGAMGLAAVRRWFNIDDTQADDTPAANYYETSFKYDGLGRRTHSISTVSAETSGDPPTTEIHAQVTNVEYLSVGPSVSRVQQGVIVKGATAQGGYSGGAAVLFGYEVATGPQYPNDDACLIALADLYYDDPDSDTEPEQGYGDGRLSWMRTYVSHGTASESVLRRYASDVRGRVLWTRAYDGTGTTAAGPVLTYAYDDQDRMVAAGTYTVAQTDWVNPADDSATQTNRRALSERFYDEMGRLYRTQAWSIESNGSKSQTGGQTAAPLQADLYYDLNSRVVAYSARGSGAYEWKYDGEGRVVRARAVTSLNATKYADGKYQYVDDPTFVADAAGIVSDVAYIYALASGAPTLSLRRVISRELNHTDANGMDLTSSQDSIVTYTHFNYDTAHRLSDVIVHGTVSTNGLWTNGTGEPTYGATPPTSSLVSSRSYDAAGRLATMTDPKGVVTQYEYDDLARVISVVEDQGDTSHINRTTEYAYNGLSDVVRIKAISVGDFDASHGGNDDQWTEYVYGSAQNAGRLTAILYPTGHGEDGVIRDEQDENFIKNSIALAYNVDGTLHTRRDQNNTTLTYEYDALRRRSADVVADLGSSVDGAARRVDYAYTERGQLASVATNSSTGGGAGTVTSTVAYSYNGLGQLTSESQDVDGAGQGGAHTVEYGYAGLSPTEGASLSRLVNLTYPNGRKVWYGYSQSSTSTFQDEVNNAFSRVGQIALDNNGSQGYSVAEYRFNGLSRMVAREYGYGSSLSGGSSSLDYSNLEPGGYPTTGSYPGFDQFGRIVDHSHRAEWTAEVGGPSSLSRTQYGYDRNSNRLYAKRPNSLHRSEVYTYDNLDRLTSTKAGIPNTAADPPTIASYRPAWYDEDWTLDKLGNWTAHEALSAGETRAHNATNEITQRTTADVGPRTLINYDFSGAWGGFDQFYIGDDTDWAVTNGKVTSVYVDGGGPLNGSMNYAITGDPDWTNLGARVDVTWPSEEDWSSPMIAGLVFGFSDLGEGLINCWLLAYGANTGPNNVDQRLVFECVDGTWYLRSSQNYTTDVFYPEGTNTLYTTYTPDLAIIDSNIAYHWGTNPPGRFGLFLSKSGIMLDNLSVFNLSRQESLDGRWSDWGGRWVTDESNGYLAMSGAGYSQKAITVRAGVQARYFRYDLTLKDAGTRAYDYIGPAFGVQDPDNYFMVYCYHDSATHFVFSRINQGHRGESLAYYHLPGLLSAGDHIIRVEVTYDEINQRDSATITLDPDTGNSVTLFSALNMTYYGYRSGQVGTAAYGPRRVDNAKLWIDENDGNNFDKLVFDDNFSSAAITTAYDDNGNLTDDGLYQYVYDAWNRVVEVKASEGDHTTFAAYRYDGLGRRIEKRVEHSGDQDTREFYYYSGQRLIETRNGSGFAVCQYVWGTQYVDEIVREDLNGDPGTGATEADQNDCLSGGADTAYYYHQDANYNVVAITVKNGYGMLGGVVQRISYSAYGRPTFFDAAGHPRGRPTFGPYGIHHSMAIGWQGLFYDLETGHSYNRARMLSHRLGRFLQRDPLGYVDGMSLYEYLGSNSLNMLDPLGLEVGFIEGIGNYILVGQRETGVPPGELWGAAGEGALEGAQGGASIAGNTLTFGATDKLGITNSEQYEGEVYAGSRVAATVARESLLAAGGGVLGRLATNGSRVFGALARGANTAQRGRNAYNNAEEVYDVVVDVKEVIEYLGSDDPCATDGGATRRLLQTVAERLVQRAVHASRPSANAGVVAGRRKPGPSTDPNAPHNAAIRQRAKVHEEQGDKILAGGGGKERLIPTPGGHKSGRRPDLIYETPEGRIGGENIGLTRADGMPVQRELEALEDLNGPGGLPTEFFPYEKRED